MERITVTDDTNMDMEPSERMHIYLTGKRSTETSRKDRALKFPIKLMYAIECGDYRDIIDWSPSGLAFIIINPKKFEKTVLPDIFKDAKFNSFDRKIKRWGFIKGKVSRGTVSCCYGHSNFQRGDYKLCMTISCSKNQMSQAAEFPALTPMVSSMPTQDKAPEVDRNNQPAPNDLDLLRSDTLHLLNNSCSMRNYNSASAFNNHISSGGVPSSTSTSCPDFDRNNQTASSHRLRSDRSQFLNNLFSTIDSNNSPAFNHISGADSSARLHHGFSSDSVLGRLNSRSYGASSSDNPMDLARLISSKYSSAHGPSSASSSSSGLSTRSDMNQLMGRAAPMQQTSNRNISPLLERRLAYERMIREEAAASSRDPFASECLPHHGGASSSSNGLSNLNNMFGYYNGDR